MLSFLVAAAAFHLKLPAHQNPPFFSARNNQHNHPKQQLVPPQQRRNGPLHMVATNQGLFTQSNPADRRVTPDDPNGRATFKVVYVVLESQYQSSLTAACKRINAGQDKVCVECSGYILEELRDETNFAQFKKDVQEANIFIGRPRAGASGCRLRLPEYA
jgi:hypothetical protein